MGVQTALDVAEWIWDHLLWEFLGALFLAETWLTIRGHERRP